MGDRRFIGRLIGSLLLVGLLGLAGCTLFQPKVGVDFTASATTGAPPLIVEFTPQVAEEIAACSWDFGDGETSTSLSPVHVYRAAGTYDVFLSVTTVDGAVGSADKKGLIEVKAISAKEQIALLYWLNKGDGTIHRGDRSGSLGASTIVSYIYDANDLAVADGYVFWTSDDVLYRSAYDGSARTMIASNQTGLYGVTVDTELHQIYWTCLPSSPFSTSTWQGSVKRAGLDGSSVTKVRTFNDYNSPFAWWIRADGSGERVYWYSDDYNIVVPMGVAPSAANDAQFQFGYVPGLSPHLVKGSLGGISAMALDVSDGPAYYIYWTAGKTIQRCRVDGSDTTTVLGNLNSPRGIAVDLREGKMYWSDAQGIHRADLDGGNGTLIYPGARADVLVIQE